MSASNGHVKGSEFTPKTRRKANFMDIVPGQHKPKLARNGAIFVVITAIFLWVIYTKPPLPFSSSGPTVRADFQYATDVIPGRTPVRVHGIDVGIVTGATLLPGNRGVEVTMTLNSNPGVTVKQDASASLRWRTLLGLNYYVDLTPGSASAPQLGGGVIPVARTSSQVELDQVLEPLNRQGRHASQTLIDQFDAGFSDPSAVRTVIHATAPAMRNLALGLPSLRGTNPGVDLPNVITQTNKWITVLQRDETNVGSLIDNGNTALAVTAAHSIDLGSTLDNAPSALSQTQATMSRLRATLDVLNPIAQQLEPGASKLYRAATLARSAVSLADPLLSDLEPTLNAIHPSVVSLAAAARAGTPVLTSLTSTLNRTQSTFIPFLNSTSSETKLKFYNVVGPALASVSSALGYGDKYGALAGFEAGFGENTIGGVSPCATFIANPDVTQKITCAALTQLITSLYSGRSILQPLLGSPVAASLVNKLLGVTK
jgi:virulence factor Mce-like protein